jgi:pimeloyl-ACP methyl ester carboxylesterase
MNRRLRCHRTAISKQADCYRPGRRVVSVWWRTSGFSRRSAISAVRSAPTLVFAGDRDAQITVDLTVSLYEVLPNAELAVCPDADHAAPIGARAGVFAAAIRDFAFRHAGS